MAPTRLIAGLMGPLMFAMGVAMLLNRSLFPAMAAELERSYIVIFLSGLLSLLAGIAIIRVHNVWSGGWPVIVTVVGWLAIVGGLARMWFPQMAAPIAASLGNQPAVLILAGLVLLGIGAFLSYKAYGPAN